MAYLPAGIQDANFQSLIETALANNGFKSVADFIEKIHDYYEDEQEWRELFPLALDSNPDRVFKQRVGTEYVPIMASYIADDADTPLMTNDAAGIRTGSIPRMGNGYLFDAASYEDSRRIIALSSVSRGLQKAFDSFLLDNIKLVATIHQQRTFTSLQVESKGQYVSTIANNSGGIAGVKIGMVIPEGHKFKAGFGVNGAKSAWSGSGSKPLGDLMDLYEYGWRNRVFRNDPSKLVFRMSQSLYTLLKTNASVKLAISFWKSGALVGTINPSSVAGLTITDQDLREYMVGIGLPEIEVVPTCGFTPYFDSQSKVIRKEALSAFDPDTVVLRERGAIGEMQWFKVTNIFSTSANPMYYTDNGSIAIQQDTNTAKRAVKFSAESLCVPVLSTAESILYLDTANAASND